MGRSRYSFASALALAVAASCGKAPSPAVTAKVPVVVAVAGPDAATTARPKAPELPPRIEDPAPVSCRFTAKQYEGHMTLMLGPEGNSFAYASLMTDVEATLSDTNLDAVGISFTASTHVFHATIHIRDLKLFAKRPRVWSGIAVPHADGALGHVSFAKRKTSVEPACRGVRFFENPYEEATCDDLTMEPGAYAALDAVPGKKSGKQVGLRPGKPIPLSIESRGKPVAEIDPDAWPFGNALVTDTQADRKRIIWNTDGCLVFGWIPTKSVLGDTEEITIPLRGPMGGGGTPLAPEEPVSETLQCKTDVPLVVEMGSARHTIGAVRKSWSFHVAQHQADGWSRLVMPEALLWEGARLFVRTTDIESCDKQPERSNGP